LWISFPPIHEHVGSIVVMNPFVRSPGYHVNGEKWEIDSKDDMITGGTLGVSENLHLIRQESSIIVIRPCLFRSRRLASRIFSLSRQLAAKSPPTYLLPWYHRANLKENNVSNAQLIPPHHRRDEVGRNNIALGGVVVCIDVDRVLPSSSWSASRGDGEYSLQGHENTDPPPPTPPPC
jgi:hypothetical protein